MSICKHPSSLPDDERVSFPSAPSRSGSSALILLAHGSNDAHWRAYFERIRDVVRAQEFGAKVRLAFMEFTGPTLRDTVAECLLDGAKEIDILPLFLNTGAHLVRDVPAQIKEIRREHPSVAINLLPAVGEDPRMSSLLIQIARESLQRVEASTASSREPQ